MDRSERLVVAHEHLPVTVSPSLNAGEEIHGEELEMCRADGKSIWVSLTVRPMRNLAVDVTERKQAEEAIRKA